MSQRQYPQLAKIQVKLNDGNLFLSINSVTIKPFIFTPKLTGKLVEVNIWRDQTMAIDQGDEVAQWFQTALQLAADQTCRLVRQSPEYPRSVNPDYAIQQTDQVSFADGYPFLLTNTASLNQLNQQIYADNYPHNLEIPMVRFRPNLVVETHQPFIEDSWKWIQIGEIKFAVVKPCDRCNITITNQTTGERDLFTEPLKTLSTFRRQPGGIMFGQNLIPQNTGSIRINDVVKVLESE